MLLYSSLSLDVSQSQSDEIHHMKASHRFLKIMMLLQTQAVTINLQVYSFSQVILFLQGEYLYIQMRKSKAGL